jgi:hypothetical protein
MTDLAQHIEATPLMDTHEHLNDEKTYVENGPDVLCDLFDNYVKDDLVSAGASPDAVKRLLDKNDPDIAGRFRGVEAAWRACEHTGYGEAVGIIARQVYKMEEITVADIEAGAERNLRMRQPGERLYLLKTVANLDHVQIDDFSWSCAPDPSGPDFFLYDLNWMAFCDGRFDSAELQKETGIEVRDLSTLGNAVAALFTKYAPCAIAVKTQHAYARTLTWQERDEADVERALRKHLANAGREDALTEAERLCLGDWCWARGVEEAIVHNLPFKIHTGHYAGTGYMPMERIRPAHLCPLLAKYPAARFVLMHIAYPYQDELVSLAKHYPNVWVDLCWAWSIDPFSARDFVRRMIHAVPSNKLFAFGGDTFWPNASVAYALMARHWLIRTLQDEVDDSLLSEKQAIALATRWMRTNQEACFDLVGTRAAIAAHVK